MTQYRVHSKLFAVLSAHSSIMDQTTAELMYPASVAIDQLTQAIAEGKVSATHYWVGYIDGLRKRQVIHWHNKETERFYREYSRMD